MIAVQTKVKTEFHVSLVMLLIKKYFDLNPWTHLEPKAKRVRFTLMINILVILQYPLITIIYWK